MGEEVVGAEDDAVVFITDAGNAALHGFRSSTASNRHGIAIPSSTPPKVSLPVSLLAAGPCCSAMALHTGSV